MQAKIETLKAKNSNNEEYLVYPRTLIKCVTNEHGDNLEDKIKDTILASEGTVYVDYGDREGTDNFVPIDANTLEGHHADYFATAEALTTASTAANTYTDTAITNLVNGAPETLDTLKELADAMKENDDVVAALDAAIGSKANASTVDAIINGTTTVGNANKLGGKGASEYVLKDDSRELVTLFSSITTPTDIRAIMYNLPSGHYTCATTSYPNVTFPFADGVGTQIEWERLKHANGYYYGTLTITSMIDNSQWVTCSVYNNSQYTEWQSFLPKSGGAIGVGNTTIPFGVKGADGSSFINYLNHDDTFLGFLGMNGANKPSYITADRSTTYDLLHTGDNGAMFARGITPAASLNTVQANGSYYVSPDSTDRPGAYGQMLVMRNADTMGQLYIIHAPDKEGMKYRGGSDRGGFYPWKTVIDDSNVGEYAIAKYAGQGNNVYLTNKDGKGHSELYKNNSTTADYGTIIRDVNSAGSMLDIELSANNNKAYFIGTDRVSKELLHTGNVGNYALTLSDATSSGINDVLCGSVSIGNNISITDVLNRKKVTFFTNWHDATNFPNVYGSGVVVPCLDGSCSTIFYSGSTIDGRAMYIGKAKFDGSTWNINWTESARADDLENYLPKSGGTLNGQLNVGGKVELYTDGEGGNLSLTSPNGTRFSFDAFENDGIRFIVNESSVPMKFSANGTISASTFVGNLSGNASSASTASTSNWVNPNNTMQYGISGMQYFNQSMTASNDAGENNSPTSDWYHIIRMNHANANGYYVDLGVCFHNDILAYKRVSSGVSSGWVTVLDNKNYTNYCAPANVFTTSDPGAGVASSYTEGTIICVYE